MEGGGGSADVGMWRSKGHFKLQSLRIGHKAHVARGRDHTNLIFVKEGNADNEESEVNCF